MPAEAMTRGFIPTFARSSLAWMIAAATVATVHSLWANMSSGLVEAVWTSIRELPQACALLFPIVLFAGAVHATGTVSASRVSSRDILFAAVGSAVIAFLLAGFIAPWLGRMLVLSAPAGAVSMGDVGAQTVIAWGREYGERRADVIAGRPVLGWMVAVAGIQLCLPFIAGALAGVMSALGVIVGRRTAAVRNRSYMHAHNWGAGFILVASVVLALNFALTLSVEHGVTPFVAIPLVLAVPVLLLGALVWSDLVGVAAASSRLLPASVLRAHEP